MFHPFDPNQALLATELGVWTCDNLSEVNIDWEPSNDGLANVRTDMLRFRAADSLLLAATHGRGVFTSEVFRDVRVRFQQGTLSLAEGNTDGIVAGCRPYRDHEIIVEISRPSPSPTQVALTVSGGSASTADYDFPNGNVVTFPADDPADQAATLRVYDDGQPELGETLTLSLTPVGAIPAEAPQALTLTLMDRDPDFASLGITRPDTVLFEDFEGGALPAGWSMTNANTNSDNYQFGTAAALSSPAWPIPTAGNVSLIAVTSDGICACSKIQDRLISPIMDLSLASNVQFNFDAFFDGEFFSAGLRTSIDGGTTWSGLTPITQGATWRNFNVILNGLAGESQARIAFEFSDFGASSNRGLAVDNLRVTADQPFSIPSASVLGASDTQEFGPLATVRYFDANDRVIATLENLSNADFGCTEFVVDRAGNGSTDFWDASDDSYDLADKTLRVTPTLTPANGLYRITLYYSAEEVQGWEAATGKSFVNDARIIKTGGAISQVTPATPFPAGPIEQVVDAVVPFGPAGDYAISATFSSGFSGFGVGDPGIGSPFPVELLGFMGEAEGTQIALRWEVGPEVNLSHYDLQREGENGLFQPLGQVKATGQAAYDWLDLSPQPGRNRYRLQSVDLDGSRSRTALVEVTLTAAGGAAEVFPNPFAEHLWLRVPAGPAPVAMSLFGTDGRRLWQGSMPPGQVLDLTQAKAWPALSPGIYFLQVNQPGQRRQVVKLSRR
jgi:hypothetical protein